MITAHGDQSLEPLAAQATPNRTIFVANAGLTATQFDLTTDQRSTLVRNGAEAATRFLVRCADAGGVPRSA